jgi:hypothetical protein
MFQQLLESQEIVLANCPLVPLRHSSQKLQVAGMHKCEGGAVKYERTRAPPNPMNHARSFENLGVLMSMVVGGNMDEVKRRAVTSDV